MSQVYWFGYISCLAQSLTGPTDMALHMSLVLFTFTMVIFHQVSCERLSNTIVTCAEKPPNCYENSQAVPNCAANRIKAWYPTNSVGVAAACGRCFYCRPRVVRADNRARCPENICPTIPPTCSKIEPVMLHHEGRRCRGCSKCVSYSVCPPQNCPPKLEQCEVYAPSYRYVDTHLCKDCDVCARYKTGWVRPPSTPLPCPEFNLDDCVLSHRCLTYEKQLVNMGEDRMCEVCPICTEWEEPQGPKPAFTLEQARANPDLPFCDDAVRCGSERCARQRNYEKTAGGHYCRACDTCKPDTVDCDSIKECFPDGACRCVTQATAKPRCGELTCSRLPCFQTKVMLRDMPGTEWLHCAECPECIINNRDGADSGNDAGLSTPVVHQGSGPPDRRNDRGGADTSENNPSSGSANVDDPTPDCQTIADHMHCPAISCAITITERMNINGVECRGCPRCVSDVPSTCPLFQCPAIDCGDNEDIHAGKRYRQTKMWQVDDTQCEGCEECTNCPYKNCAYQSSCLQYARRTDINGCHDCPHCEIWDSRNGPPLANRTGFVQNVFTALCMTSRDSASSLVNEVEVNQCQFLESLDAQDQVWTFLADGLIKDQRSGLCLAYSQTYDILTMRRCSVGHSAMLWELIKHTRYPQFFRIGHRYLAGKCIDAEGQSSHSFGTTVRLSTCQDLEKTGGFWSDQWWKFEEYYEQN